MPDTHPNPPPPTLDYAPPPKTHLAVTHLIFSTLLFLFGTPLIALGLVLLIFDKNNSTRQVWICVTLLALGAALCTLAFHLQRLARLARSRSKTIKI